VDKKHGGDVEMVKENMYITVQTLLEKGNTISDIARICKIDRKTVRSIQKKLKAGIDFQEKATRTKKLDQWTDLIKTQIEEGWSADRIHENLVKFHQADISYATVQRFVQHCKGGEAFAPLITDPGEEAQVDFGYAGLLMVEGKRKKCWIFCLVLSYSRYAYYELVTDQKSETFLTCHRHGFEYFGGVPRTIRLDNLKSGVLSPDWYEPILQAEYAKFLKHYGSYGDPCHNYSPEEKGKIESGVKYVKKNCLKRLTVEGFEEAKEQVRIWNREVCNTRLHGTTRKIPKEEWLHVEKPVLQSLPSVPYPICRLEFRKVNRYGHIAYGYNFYSVPYQYVGQVVMVKNQGSLLRIYQDQKEIALHPLESVAKGNFITQEPHKMPWKQRQPANYFEMRASGIGEFALLFLSMIQKKSPNHWHRTMQGIFHLEKNHTKEAVNQACQRAIQFKSLSYRSIRAICEKHWFTCQSGEKSSVLGGGYFQELSLYDQITQIPKISPVSVTRELGKREGEEGNEKRETIKCFRKEGGVMNE
jgi:transposase